jgi:hypothetical protein
VSTISIGLDSAFSGQGKEGNPISQVPQNSTIVRCVGELWDASGQDPKVKTRYFATWFSATCGPEPKVGNWRWDECRWISKEIDHPTKIPQT